MRKYSFGNGSLGIERTQNGYIVRWVQETFKIVSEGLLEPAGSTHVITVLEDGPNAFKSHIELLDFIIGYFNMDQASKEQRIKISLGRADNDTYQEWHGDPHILEEALRDNEGKED